MIEQKGKKRFLTLLPFAENLHLRKEVGMVPYIMYSHFNYDSTIACYKNGDYPALDVEVKGLKIVFIKKIFKNQLFDTLWFLLNNSRKYNILQMYHWVMPNLFCLLFFKALKFGKCCTYLRLDADKRIKKTKGFKLWAIKKILKFIDITSIETLDLYSFMNKDSKCKFEYMPNGFYDYGEKKAIKYNEKENIVITVGRIGTEQKATDVLLNGFTIFAEKNPTWKLYIVGTIETEFNKYKDAFFKEHPHMVERIIFFGPIYNRDTLLKLYESSKLFTLTSRWESFGIVYVEALQSGCYIISTDITPAYDVTDNLKYGALFPIDDYNALATLMEKMSKNESFLKKCSNEGQEFVYENFYWPKILQKLDLLINKKFEKI